MPCCAPKTLFTCSCAAPLFLRSFCPLFHNVPWQRYRCGLLFSVLGLAECLCVNSIYSKQILVWWRSGDGLTIYYNDKPLVVSLILCPFSRIILLGSLLGTMTCLGPIMMPGTNFILQNRPWSRSESGRLLPWHLCHGCANGRVLLGPFAGHYWRSQGFTAGWD